MSLCFAAITPHPPLLIPNIAKDQLGKIQKTKEAMERLEQDLYLAKPEVIIIISPHGGLFEDSFAVNAHNKYLTSFDKFGDLVTKKEWGGAPNIVAKLSHESRSRNIPVRLVSKEALDHGTSVPLFYLTEHLPDIKVMPIGFCNLLPKDHLIFGEFLKDILMNQDKRVAVIASGDLSHRLSDDSPGGYHEAGQKFDDKIIKLLEKKDISGIAKIDEKLIKDASQCGYRTILILLGILQNMDCQFENYSYEAPFGVGYLVGHFAF